MLRRTKRRASFVATTRRLVVRSAGVRPDLHHRHGIAIVSRAACSMKKTAPWIRSLWRMITARLVAAPQRRRSRHWHGGTPKQQAGACNSFAITSAMLCRIAGDRHHADAAVCRVALARYSPATRKAIIQKDDSPGAFRHRRHRDRTALAIARRADPEIVERWRSCSTRAAITVRGAAFKDSAGFRQQGLADHACRTRALVRFTVSGMPPITEHHLKRSRSEGDGRQHSRCARVRIGSARVASVHLHAPERTSS